jgi:GlpG protein
LGRQVETKFSSTQLVLVLLITGIASNILQATLVNNQFAGLSGVTYGLAGYVWLSTKLMPKQGLMLSDGVFVFLMLWMLLGFADVLPIPMANWAHLGGLITGLIMASVQRLSFKS